MSQRTRPFEIDEYLNDYTVLLSDSGRSPEGTIEVRTDDEEIVSGRVVGAKRGKPVVELLVSDLDSYGRIL